MLSVLNFRKFLGYSIKAQDAVPARGTLTLNRKAGVTGIIQIPRNLTYSTSGKFYKQATSESLELSESAEFIPIVVEATQAGASGNLSELNQTFRLSQNVNVDAVNESPISGGQDAVKEVPGINPLSFEQLGWSDDRLQSALDVGTYMVRALAGNQDADFTDNILIQEAIYLCSMYRLQNHSTTESSSTLSEGLNSNSVYLFRHHAFLPLLQQVQSLISQSGKRNLDQFFGDIK